MLFYVGPTRPTCRAQTAHIVATYQTFSKIWKSRNLGNFRGWKAVEASAARPLAPKVSVFKRIKVSKLVKFGGSEF